VTLPVVMGWLDEQASPRVGMSGEGRRQTLNFLSRFFSWAIARGLATVNPVKMIPTGSWMISDPIANFWHVASGGQGRCVAKRRRFFAEVAAEPSH
jgi:hypothetical protein